MIYLLVALLLATRADGFLYAVLTALGSVVAYNFFFTVPRFTFHAYGLSAPVIFTFLLVGTLAASSLAIRLKHQAAQAARRSYRTEVLLESSRKLQAAPTLAQCLETAAAQVVKILDRPVVIYEADPVAAGGLAAPRVYDVPGTGGGDAGAAALTGQNARGALRIGRRDRRSHASPNSAQTEAVMAGALGVQLAGPASYFGKLYEKPTIGDALRPVEPGDILRANRMLYAAGTLCMALLACARAAVCLPLGL